MGRGTVDTKGNLFCFLTAVEELIAEGFIPKTDIYLTSTCTEEWAGEGGMVADEPIKGVLGKYAMIGVLEKGIGDLKFTARGSGGMHPHHLLIHPY